MPGLIGGHVHSNLSPLRGVAQDMTHWMRPGLAPFAARMTPDDAVAGAALTAVDAIRAGTTLLADFSRQCHGSASSTRGSVGKLGWRG